MVPYKVYTHTTYIQLHYIRGRGRGVFLSHIRLRWIQLFWTLLHIPSDIANLNFWILCIFQELYPKKLLKKLFKTQNLFFSSQITVPLKSRNRTKWRIKLESKKNNAHVLCLHFYMGSGAHSLTKNKYISCFNPLFDHFDPFWTSI